MAGVLIVAGMWALVLVPALLVRRAPLGGQLGFPVAQPARLAPGRLAPTRRSPGSFAPIRRAARPLDRTSRRSAVITTVLVPGVLTAAIGLAGGDQAIAAIGALFFLLLATYLLLVAVTSGRLR